MPCVLAKSRAMRWRGRKTGSFVAVDMISPLGRA
jgi:hypothetical protein